MRHPDKSIRLPSGRVVRLGRQATPECPWQAVCIGTYFMVHRSASCSSFEPYREPFTWQSTVLETKADAEALAEALNARAERLAAAGVLQDSPEAA